MIYSPLFESNYYSIMYLLSITTGKYYILLSNVIIFLIGYLSTFYLIMYFSRKYSKINETLAFLIATCFSLIYSLYPFYGSGFYIVFDSFLPVIFILFDKFFTEYYLKARIDMLSAIFVVTLIASFAITDFRTILYVPAIFLSFFFFYNAINHTRSYFKKTAYMALISLLFLITLELRYIISVYLIAHIGTSALGSTFSLQTPIAYQSFPLLNSITGMIQWYTTYRPDLVVIGLIPFLLILIALRISGKLNLLKLMVFILLALLLLDSYGGKTVNLIIGQTSFSSYLPILYPTYEIAVLYYPILIFTSGFSFVVVIDKIFHNQFFRNKSALKEHTNILKRLKHIAPYIISISILILLMSSQLYYLEPTITNDQNEKFYDSVPIPLENAFKFLNNQNISGHIIDIGNFSNSYYNYSYWPPYTFSPQAGWGANWFLHPVDYFMEHNISNLANLLKYMGVQYILYRFSNYDSFLYLENQKNLDLVFRNSSIYIFKNQNFTTQIQSNELYVVYNLPESMTILSSMNETIPIIPFYNLLQLQQPYKFISGIVGYNLSFTSLEPLFLNTTDSFSKDIGSMPINNLNGWQQMPVINSGDDVQALAPNRASTLNITLNAPAGRYQILIVGGVSPVPTATWNYGSQDFSANASLRIFSLNSSAKINIVQNSFSPYLGVYHIDNFTYSGTDLNIQSFGDANGTPFLSYIYLIPMNFINLIKSEIDAYAKKINIINYTDVYHNNGVFMSQNKTIAHIPFAVAIYKKLTGYETGYNIVVSYNDSEIASFSFVQNANLKGELLNVGYFYGSGFVYISTLKNASLIYGNFNGFNIILINIVIISVVASLIYIPRRWRNAK